MTSKSVLALLALLAIAPFGGCKPRSGGGGQGALIDRYEDLKPDQLPLTKGVLDLAGMKIKVDLVRQENQGNLDIALMAHGVQFEIERYQSNADHFAVVEMGGESYSPPITLIKYGMRVGDVWNWAGTIRTGPIEHQATAKVTSNAEDLAINGQIEHNVVHVDVEITMESGDPNQPSKRKLQFWLARDKGVVQRKVGDLSARMPSGE